MNIRLFLLLILFFLSACSSRINQDNFNKIQPGMSMQQVTQILGQPIEVKSFNILGVSGTSATWKNHEATIVIQFLNDQVQLKVFNQEGDSQNTTPVNNSNNES